MVSDLLRAARQMAIVRRMAVRDWRVYCMFNIPGQKISVRTLAVFDGAQWTAPNKFRRKLGYVDVIVICEGRPELGEIVRGRLADEFDADSYEARKRALEQSDEFGAEAFLVIGERAGMFTCEKCERTLERELLGFVADTDPPHTYCKACKP